MPIFFLNRPIFCPTDDADIRFLQFSLENGQIISPQNPIFTIFLVKIGIFYQIKCVLNANIQYSFRVYFSLKLAHFLRQFQ